MKRFFYLLSVLATVGLCAACSGVNQAQQSYIAPYRIDVRQGNWVTQEMMSQLKPGQTREQVRFILGSPLVSDMFHADRWDYVFTIRRQGAEPQLRRIVAHFDGDLLKSLDASAELPAEREFVASIDTFKTSRQAPPLALTEEQLKSLPVPEKPPAAAAEPVGPTRSFPPLEPTR